MRGQGRSLSPTNSAGGRARGMDRSPRALRSDQGVGRRYGELARSAPGLRATGRPRRTDYGPGEPMGRSDYADLAQRLRGRSSRTPSRSRAYF